MNPGESNVDLSKDAAPSEAEIRDTLARVTGSAVFEASVRLQHFLSYVIEEKLAGREKQIKGKKIAAEVYDRDCDSADFETSQNLVSVEARRLRRLLAEYYAGDGVADPWRICIDLGGYIPRFESAKKWKSTTSAAPLPATRQARRRYVLFGAVIAVAAAAAALLTLHSTQSGVEPSTTSASRAALRARSVPALQAANLAEQARSMLFPLFDLEKQKLALEIFRHSINLDPELHHGYAGAAQVLATLGLLDPDRDAALSYSEEAMRMAETALERSPESAWAHASRAWSLAVAGQLEEAREAARLAVKLAPQDGHILDLAGITSILANDPEFAAEISSPDRERSGPGRFATNNVWGVSQYMLGNYDEAVKAFTIAPESGAPVSAPSLMFLAVSYDHLERTADARRVMNELHQTWGDFPVHSMLDRMFPYAPEVERDFIERLGKYGNRQE